MHAHPNYFIYMQFMNKYNSSGFSFSDEGKGLVVMLLYVKASCYLL